MQRSIPKEMHPINGTNSLSITHARDNRGLEIETTKDGGAHIIKTHAQYEHPNGLKTQTTDELGFATNYQYDRLNRMTEIAIL